MINTKIVSKEFLGSENLLKVDTLCIYELLEIDIICETRQLILIVLMIIMPSFERYKNGKEFPIMGFLLSFNRNHFFKKKTIRYY